MITFPNAKINLGLHVIDKQENGFHDLETVFYPVELCDILEIIPADDGLFSFHSSGLVIPGEQKGNLCIRAYELLKADFHLPAVAIHLHKVIPMGAGLGGGSSDGAFALKMLAEMFQLGLSMEQLHQYAGKLGSDCPFLLVNQPVFASGRGDRFEPAQPELSAYQIVIVVPGVHVNTARAFALLDEQRLQQPETEIFRIIHSACDLATVIEKKPETWRTVVKNDFEGPVFSSHPDLALLKQQLYDSGAIYASMSGSGSALFGIFRKEEFNLLPFKGNFIWTGGGRTNGT